MRAGHGTDHPGKGKCYVHEKSAVLRRARSNGFSQPVEVTPGVALENVLSLAYGQLLAITAMVGNLKESELFVAGDQKDSGAFEMIPHVYLATQRSIMKDVAGYSKLAIDAGIAERRTRLAESEADLIGRFMEAVFAELGLTAAQRALVGPAMRTHMSLVSPPVEVEARETVAA